MIASQILHMHENDGLGAMIAPNLVNPTMQVPDSWPDVQAPQLLPVALPGDAKALAGVADAVADYNRALADKEPIAPVPLSITAADSQSQIAASDVQPDHHQARLTPWLAASLAPIGAAVTIQAHWRGRVERQRLGAWAPQLLGRRAAVCIQRAWRMCKHCGL